MEKTVESFLSKYPAETALIGGAISGILIAGIIGFLLYGSWWGLLFWANYGLFGGSFVGLCIASIINSKNKNEIDKKNIQKKINFYIILIVVFYLITRLI